MIESNRALICLRTKTCDDVTYSRSDNLMINLHIKLPSSIFGADFKIEHDFSSMCDEMDLS